MQAAFAIGSGPALRYPADVIPFAALETITPTSLAALRDLLTPAESIYITGDRLLDLAPYGMVHQAALPGWQMHLPSASPPALARTPESSLPIRLLTREDAPAMVALTGVAFPGFFRSGTYRLGRYFGLHREGELIAMAGERIALPGFRELSAVCTHPAHIGRGYAARLIEHSTHLQRENGEGSFLHVLQANHRAIHLYERLGFVRTTAISFNRIHRLECAAAAPA